MFKHVQIDQGLSKLIQNCLNLPKLVTFQDPLLPRRMKLEITDLPQYCNNLLFKLVQTCLNLSKLVTFQDLPLPKRLKSPTCHNWLLLSTPWSEQLLSWPALLPTLITLIPLPLTPLLQWSKPQFSWEPILEVKIETVQCSFITSFFIRNLARIFWGQIFLTISSYLSNLGSGIDVGQGIYITPGKFGKKNKYGALN